MLCYLVSLRKFLKLKCQQKSELLCERVNTELTNDAMSLRLISAEVDCEDLQKRCSKCQELDSA